ncbi:MAG: hypothetical protein RL701_732, partial [Pseudomonadota bacterium]
MTGRPLDRAERALVDRIVQAYEHESAHIALFRQQLLAALTSAPALDSCVHSIRSRLKDPEHLRNKLERKLRKSDETGEKFNVTPDNLLTTVNDLVGIRILHLYTRQIREIDVAVRAILAENHFTLLEGPFARTWDDESRAYFRECG